MARNPVRKHDKRIRTVATAACVVGSAMALWHWSWLTLGGCILIFFGASFWEWASD